MSVCSSKILKRICIEKFCYQLLDTIFQNLLEVTELIFIIDFIQFSEKKIIFNLN